MTENDENEEICQYLTFLLGNETFAIEISAVREIIQNGSMTTVPLMPRYVRGVINLRGAVVPVIDLRCRFGWSPAVPGKKTCIVIFDLIQEGERYELGLMVDAVSEVVDLPLSNVEDAPSFGGAIKREYMKAVGKINDGFVVIIDPAKVLNIGDLLQSTARG